MSEHANETAHTPRRRWHWWKRKPRHVHHWLHSRRTTGGWGVARCLTCGKEDIY